ncbi:Eco57I restriction-modification methylase domain-containing protein [Burkholderia sp. AU15512]|uniref:Eco57I restriction-modification methylase domain-containing protein n=1 Tax=Burkholderia sp. AU15512 TaxID=2015345 RepID=UPI00117E2F15|nr:Eco57I restriction-modification methylase domain-containing protein [Burkholderia sp. AU15512]
MDEDLSLHRLTEDWGTRESVELYLDRCQVDTPARIVSAVWAHIRERRAAVGKVIDFGAGDGRFARGGQYESYIGYEIDETRCRAASLPPKARLISQCAFSVRTDDADICIGNPPYVRNQDLPKGWRLQAASELIARTGVSISGLANAWQYFFLLGLASTRPDGLVAIVIPYEWVSRPSAEALREFIRNKGWDVHVYRLVDDTFGRVLTTASITIVDKRSNAGSWKFFEEAPDGSFRSLPTESGGARGVVKYASRRGTREEKVYAKRGLSPGTQEVLTLTEGERVRSGLLIDSDVVPCVTSLRGLDAAYVTLDERVFKEHFRSTGAKCWLIRTDRRPSHRLQAYLDSIPAEKYQTSTCLKRDCWWAFKMPDVPGLLVATGFRGEFPKIVTNKIEAVAVGGVSGVYGLPQRGRRKFAANLRSINLANSIVPHSNGLKKLEINQLNTLLKLIASNGAKTK